MGAKVKTTITKEELGDNELGKDNLDELSEGEISFAEFIEGFGSSPLKFKVFRKPINGVAGTEVFCAVVNHEDIPDGELEAYLQQRFGGGDYRVRIFVEGIFKQTIAIAIADLFMVEKASDNGNGNNTRLQQLEAQLELERTRAADFKDTFMLKMIENMGNGNGGNSSLKDAVEIMALLQPKETPMESAISMLKTGMELSNATDGDWKSTLITTLKDVLPSVGASLQQPRLAAQQTLTPEAQQSMMEQKIKQAIVGLKAKVMSGMPVSVALDWIIANAIDPEYQLFISVIAQSDFERFSQLDAELGTEPYLTWFRTLHTGIQDEFRQNSVDENSTGADGNPQNTIVDAGSSESGDQPN